MTNKHLKHEKYKTDLLLKIRDKSTFFPHNNRLQDADTNAKNQCKID